MNKKKKRYPWEYEDKEIMERLHELKGQLDRPRGPAARQFIVSEMEMGKDELRWRQTEKANKTAERSYETATLSARSSTRLSKLAIILSTIAIIVTAVFGILDYLSDKRWQVRQIEILERMMTDQNQQLHLQEEMVGEYKDDLKATIEAIKQLEDKEAQ